MWLSALGLLSKDISGAHQRISSASSRLWQEDDVRLARSGVRYIEVVVRVDKVLCTRHIITHVRRRHLCTPEGNEVLSKDIESYSCSVNDHEGDPAALCTREASPAYVDHVLPTAVFAALSSLFCRYRLPVETSDTADM